MGLVARTRWTVRRYWSDCLGVVPDAFENTGIAVGLVHEDRYGGVQLFHREDAIVMGVPESHIELLQQRSVELAEMDFDNSNTIRKWLTDIDVVEQVIGPTFYGYTDRETFSPVESSARVLIAEDESDYDRFRSAIPDDEWEHGGLEFSTDKTVGLFVDGTLISIAGYSTWDGLIAHISVVTHPEHRSEGYGRKVVSRVTEQALSEGLIPQYRTSDAWPWSVSLARGLGFEWFATAYLGV